MFLIMQDCCRIKAAYSTVFIYSICSDETRCDFGIRQADSFLLLLSPDTDGNQTARQASTHVCKSCQKTLITHKVTLFNLIPRASDPRWMKAQVIGCICMAMGTSRKSSAGIIHSDVEEPIVCSLRKQWQQIYKANNCHQLIL